MAQKSYTLTRGDAEKSDVVIATDATSFTGDIRLIVKDTAPKSEIIKLVQLLTNTFLVENYPF
jgi:lipid A disaccharide synthetase